MSRDKAEEYLKYMLKTGIKDYQSVEGICDVRVLRRQEADTTHFLLITFWDSYESIRKFSGNQIVQARYYPEDADYLLKMEPLVTHYEIVPAVS